MFWTDLPSIIIRGLNTVYTAIGICHASYVNCLLARSGPCKQTVHITSMTNTYCYVYSVETPDDDGTVDLSKTWRILYQNKLEK